MEKIKKSELKKLSSCGTAKDITNAEYKSDFSKLEKIAYCSGTYGISGGLLKDPASGELFTITARNSLLFRLF